MMSQTAQGDRLSPRWLLLMLECFCLEQHPVASAESQGIEHKLNVCQSRPHLVPPMKLVFYEEMPRSPSLCPPRCANRSSYWLSQGRELASKASIRASLTIKKKMSQREISAPAVVPGADHVPSRETCFKPLELSIYSPGNRLSDLPGFDHADFTDMGELQVPSKALLRARSANPIQTSTIMSRGPAISMVGERQLDYWQQRPTPSVSPRPPSACKGLSSHPTYWTSLPGLPPQLEARRTLYPMAEEEGASPENMNLHFPPVEEDGQLQASPAAGPVSAGLPGPSIRIPDKKPPGPDPDAARLNSFRHSRVSEWISHPSSPARAAFLDCRASPFYQCARSPPPHGHPLPHTDSRFRSLSASTLASSIGTAAESLLSTTSSTTAQTVQSPRSRSDTLRSCGKRVTVVEEEGLPDMPDLHAHAPETETGKMPMIVPMMASPVF